MADVGEYLAVYLEPPGKVPGIGPERGRRPRDGIGRFRSPHGSTRYVWYVGGVPVSVLQVVSRDGRNATVANVYTVPASRRLGLASLLLARSREDFRSVAHAADEHLSAAGRAWRSAT